MSHFVRPFVGFALVAGVLSPFVLPHERAVTVGKIVTTHGESLREVKVTLPTAVQDIRPLALQRGVQIDGMLRAVPSQRMAIHGNPFEDAWGAPTVGGIFLATGTFDASDTDIALPAEGFSWVVGRTFNSRQETSAGAHRDSDGPQGCNWSQSTQPAIAFYDDATNTNDLVYLVYGADRFLEYQRVADDAKTFKGANGAAGVFLLFDGAGPDTYTLTDQKGNELTFFGFDTACGVAKGQLWKIKDPDGNLAYVGNSSSDSTAITDGYDAGGRITTAYDTSDRRYTYTYTTLDSVKRLTQVKAETRTGGTWSSPSGLSTVAQVDYAYYTSETYGDPGDLKTVTRTIPLTDSGVSLVQKKYYRYWEGSYDSSSSPGHPHEIKYIVDYEGVRRFDWQDTTFDDDFLTASNVSLEPYAATYFEYDSSYRIRHAWFNGECGCSGGCNGTYEFEYESKSGFSDTPNAYDVGWCTRTVVQRPDTSYMTQYWDEVGQPLSQVITDIDPDSTSPAPSKWVTSVVRNSHGFVTSIATPANCTAYTHSTGEISSSNTVGLILEYARTTSGPTTDFAEARKHKVGALGMLYYDSETAFGTSVKEFLSGVVTTEVARPFVDYAVRYPQTTSTPSTTYKYEYTPTWDGTVELAQVSSQVTEPAVTTGNNGSNSANSSTQYYRLDGTASYTKGRDAVLGYQAYTNGQVTTSIEDADTSILSDEPAGLSSTGTSLHRVTTYAYDAQGRLDVVTAPDGRKTKHYYSKLADGRLVSLTYADYEVTPKFYGPVHYAVANQAGKVEVNATVALTSNESTTALTGHVDETDADPITAMDLGSVVRLSAQIYNESGVKVTESRSFFDVPSNWAAGSDGTNYDATTFGYDDSGRRVRIKAPHGTITRTAYNLHGRTTGSWIGTDDSSFPIGGGSDNMVHTEAIEYDGGADDGNGYVTQRTEYVQYNSTGQRVTTYANDALGRALLQTNPTAPHAFNKYDNEGRNIATGLFSSTASIVVGTDDPTTETANRLALNESAYDEIGQLWKTTRHNIDAADGSDDDTLLHTYWRDKEGRVIRGDGPQLVKTFYDRLGRQTNLFVLIDDGDSAYADMDDVSGDTVAEEYQTVYGANTNDVLMSVRIDRLHSDFGGGATTGALDTNADSDVMLLTYANLKGRAQISCSWYDRFGRTTDEVQFGDYGAATFDRDPLSVPSRSDAALVTSYVYGTDGALQSTTDPRGLVKRTEYDEAGRTVKEIRNYSSGVNSGNPYGTDDNQTVRYEYVDGLRTKIIADMSSGESSEETVYIYGTTKGTPSASLVASGQLLRAVKYPDTGNTGTTSGDIDSVSTDVVSYAYNAQGQVVYQKDQAGGELVMEFDTAGRDLHRRVTTLASGFDGAVLRQSRTYDGLGRPSLVTQYNNATVGSGSVTDEVSYTYDGWGGITSYKQDKDSAVSGGGDYEVQYSYGKATTGRNTVRRETMTLPSSKVITFDYTNNLDTNVSRVSRVKDGATTLAKYDYLGASRVVGTAYLEPGISSAVYTYSDYLDRFNRITKNRWTADTPNKNFYEVEISYDRNSNITWVEDNVHSGFDVKYAMDDLDRLVDAEEGTRSGGSIATRKRHQTWTTLDHLGNWDRSKLDLDGDDNWNETKEYDDTRTNNKVNEITARDTDSNGTANHTLTYDGNGNLTDDGESHEYEYDAFNRLRRVRNRSNDALLAEYGYNGIGHMIKVLEDTNASGSIDGSDVTFCPAYDEGWREVARYRSGDTSPKEEFVNAMAGLGGYGRSSYINDVICRNRDNTNGWLGNPDSTLEERYYCCPNWRGDMVALVHSARYMAEWVKYSPCGIPFGLPGGDSNSDGDCDGPGAGTDTAQILAWHNGSVYDVRGDVDLDGDVDGTDWTMALAAPINGNVLGWGNLGDDAFRNNRGLAGYNYTGDRRMTVNRNRVYVPGDGRWVQREPYEYASTPNMYLYVGGNPTRYVDWNGLEPDLGPTEESVLRRGLLFGGEMIGLQAYLGYRAAKDTEAERPSGDAPPNGKSEEGPYGDYWYERGGQWTHKDTHLSNHMRHCVWMCRTCKGTSRSFAGSLGLAHEIDNFSARFINDTLLDLISNSVGLKCCNDIWEWPWNWASNCVECCLNNKPAFAVAGGPGEPRVGPISPSGGKPGGGGGAQDEGHGGPTTGGGGSGLPGAGGAMDTGSGWPYMPPVTGIPNGGGGWGGQWGYFLPAAPPAPPAREVHPEERPRTGDGRGLLGGK